MCAILLKTIQEYFITEKNTFKTKKLQQSENVRILKIYITLIYC